MTVRPIAMRATMDPFQVEVSSQSLSCDQPSARSTQGLQLLHAGIRLGHFSHALGFALPGWSLDWPPGCPASVRVAIDRGMRGRLRIIPA